MRAQNFKIRMRRAADGSRLGLLIRKVAHPRYLGSDASVTNPGELKKSRGDLLNQLFPVENQQLKLTWTLDPTQVGLLEKEIAAARIGEFFFFLFFCSFFFLNSLLAVNDSIAATGMAFTVTSHATVAFTLFIQRRKRLPTRFGAQIWSFVRLTAWRIFWAF
jgi:hypothetical protein